MRWTSPVLAGVAMALALLPKSAVVAGTPTYSTGSVSYSHDPDDGAANPAPFGKTVLSVPGTMPGTFQINNTFTNGANSSSAAGKMARFASTSQAGFDLGTGTGISQSDPGNVYNGSAALTIKFDLTFDIGTGANAFGPNVTGYGAFAVAGTLGGFGSATFNATINYTNFSKGTNWRTQAVFSQTFTNGGAGSVPFSMNFANNKYLNSPGNSISNDRLRIWGTVAFTAHNLGGPTDLTPLYCEFSGAPPTGSWAGANGGSWHDELNWIDPDGGSSVENPRIANGIGQRARFRQLPSALPILTIDIQDVATTVQSLDISAATSHVFTGGVPFRFDATTGNALLFVTPTYGDGAHSMNAGVQLNDDLDIDVRTVNPFTFNGLIGGTQALNSIGSGTTVLASGAPNAYTGGTNIVDGYINANTNGSLGSGPVVATGGQLNWNHPQATSQIIQTGPNGQVNYGFNPLPVHISQVADLGCVQGSGDEFQAMTVGGNLLLSPGAVIGHETFDTNPAVNNPVGLGVAPQYNFGICTDFVSAGVSFIAGSASGSVWKGFGADRGVRTFGDGSTSVLTIAGTGELVALNHGRLNLAANLASSGPAQLIKRGNGAAAINFASNSFAGTVVVEGGDLVVNGVMHSVTSTQVQSGASLGGHGSVSGDTTVNGGGSVSPGDSDIGTIHMENLTMLTGSHLAFDLSLPGVIGGETNDLIILSGTANLAGVLLDINALDGFGEGPGNYTLLTFTGTYLGAAPAIGNAPGDFAYTVTVLQDLAGGSVILGVPEPGAVLAISALAGAMLRRRRT